MFVSWFGDVQWSYRHRPNLILGGKHTCMSFHSIFRCSSSLRRSPTWLPGCDLSRPRHHHNHRIVLALFRRGRHPIVTLLIRHLSLRTEQAHHAAIVLYILEPRPSPNRCVHRRILRRRNRGSMQRVSYLSEIVLRRQEEEANHDMIRYAFWTSTRKRPAFEFWKTIDGVYDEGRKRGRGAVFIPSWPSLGGRSCVEAAVFSSELPSDSRPGRPSACLLDCCLHITPARSFAQLCRAALFDV
jgi:hypothetical protein